MMCLRACVLITAPLSPCRRPNFQTPGKTFSHGLEMPRAVRPSIKNCIAALVHTPRQISSHATVSFLTLLYLKPN